MDALSVDLDVVGVGEVDEDIVVGKGVSHPEGFYCNWLSWLRG